MTPLVMTPPATAPDFLARAGWDGARIEPLAGDASFRRYFRVFDERERAHRVAVLMDSPPPHEDPRPFLAMADWLDVHGLRAPRVLARDLDRGLVLLEDFGDVRMREYVDANPGEERATYERVVRELVRLRGIEPPGIPDYSESEYLREANLLTEWFAPAAGLTVDANGYDALWREAIAPLLDGSFAKVAVLRDYHAENIMLLGDGSLGLLDFQDALAGHPAYDLVSMLEDARREVSPGLAAEMVDLYCQLTGEGADFRRAYALLGAQRNAKIIGIFTRLWKRDGKPRYLDYLPHMWRMMERDLDQPGLEKLKTWFDANIPASARGALAAA